MRRTTLHHTNTNTNFLQVCHSTYTTFAQNLCIVSRKTKCAHTLLNVSLANLSSGVLSVSFPLWPLL